jgi:hypothetical protein
MGGGGGGLYHSRGAAQVSGDKYYLAYNLI